MDHNQPKLETAGLSARSYVPNRKTQRSAAVIALIALVIDTLTVRSIFVLAPLIRTGLGIDESQFGYVVGAFMGGTFLATLPFGSVLGSLNMRWVFGILMALLGIGLFVLGVQETIVGLSLVLFILGMLRAGLIPLVNRAIAENFDPSKRGTTIGLIFAGVPLGGFLGAITLPALGEALSWRAAYTVLGVVALACGVIAWVLLPSSKNPAKTRGAKFEISFLRSIPFLILSLFYALYVLGMTADVFFTLYLVDVVKVSAVAAGAFYGLIQLTGVGGRIMWGFLADRYFRNNRWWMLAFLSGLTTVSFVLLIGLKAHSPSWLVAVVMVGFGLSIASAWGILSALVGDIVGLSQVAAATAVVLWMTNIADTSGPVLFSTLLKVTRSYQSTFSLYAGLTLLVMLSFTVMALTQHRFKSPEVVDVKPG